MLEVGAAANKAATSARRMRIPRLLFSFMAASGGCTLGTADNKALLRYLRSRGMKSWYADLTLPSRSRFWRGFRIAVMMRWSHSFVPDHQLSHPEPGTGVPDEPKKW